MRDERSMISHPDVGEQEDLQGHVSFFITRLVKEEKLLRVAEGRIKNAAVDKRASVRITRTSLHKHMATLIFNKIHSSEFVLSTARSRVKK